MAVRRLLEVFKTISRVARVVLCEGADNRFKPCRLIPFWRLRLRQLQIQMQKKPVQILICQRVRVSVLQAINAWVAVLACPLLS